MPIIMINDYTWRQTSDKIIIIFPIHGKRKKVDVFAIDNYVKISYHPFMLELFLWHNIVEEKSDLVLGESSAVLTLKKAEIDQEWANLIIDHLSRDKKCEIRTQAIERAQSAAEITAKAKQEKRQQLQRQAVTEQIALDTDTLNRIDAIRDQHRREAMTELEEWKSTEEKPILSNEYNVIQENKKSYRAPLKWFKSEATADNKNYEISHNNTDTKITSNQSKIPGKNNFSVRPATGIIIEELSNEECQVIHENMDKKINQEDQERGKKIIERILSHKNDRNCGVTTTNNNNITNNGLITKNSIFDDSDDITSVPPRQCGRICVTFSERAFPTPARESYQLDEQEWLEKQAEARRKSGFITEDLRPEEQNPLWLKDKGDEFFKAGNYLAAVSAYTTGINLSNKMTSLYANRSAAQYALGNYRRCAEDCSTALELMIPKCEGNRESRARCHARLGAALCKLSAPQHGIPELKEALKLSPDNETIKRDLTEVMKYFQLNDNDDN